LELQAVARRLAALVKHGTQEKNRLHAEQSRGLSRAVQEDLAESLAQLAQRIKHLEQQGRQLIAADEELERCYQLLLSVRGIGQRSAVLLLAELAVLPPGLSAPQWVAHAGLDPRHVQSGSSVHKPSRISRCGNAHLRHALYMPALVAVRYEPRVRAFYEELLRRGKAPLQALTAVMRKLLHSLYGMLKTRTPFDGEKFRAQLPAAPAAPPELCLAEPRFVPVALSSFAAETRGLGQGRRSRRSEPLTQTPARQSSPRRRGAITT
jgi:transposase